MDSRISVLQIKEDEMKGNEGKRGNYDCSTLHKPDCSKKINVFCAYSDLLAFEWC